MQFEVTFLPERESIDLINKGKHEVGAIRLGVL
jgi:hypothetical protein